VHHVVDAKLDKFLGRFHSERAQLNRVEQLKDRGIRSGAGRSHDTTTDFSTATMQS